MFAKEMGFVLRNNILHYPKLNVLLLSLRLFFVNINFKNNQNNSYIDHKLPNITIFQPGVPVFPVTGLCSKELRDIRNEMKRLEPERDSHVYPT